MVMHSITSKLNSALGMIGKAMTNKMTPKTVSKVKLSL